MKSELISYVNNDSLFLFEDINGSKLFFETAKSNKSFLWRILFLQIYLKGFQNLNLLHVIETV